MTGGKSQHSNSGFWGQIGKSSKETEGKQQVGAAAWSGQSEGKLRARNVGRGTEETGITSLKEGSSEASTETTEMEPASSIRYSLHSPRNTGRQGGRIHSVYRGEVDRMDTLS